MRWDDEANKVAPSMDRKVLSINPDTGIPAYVNMGEMLEFISSNVQKGDPGFDAYEVWAMQPGNEGKTIEDYFIFLQNPAYEAGLTAVGAAQIALGAQQASEEALAGSVAAMKKSDDFSNEAEDVEVEEGKFSSKHFSIKSGKSAGLSQKWANEAENVPVEGGEFSAKHYSLKAAAEKQAAVSAKEAAELAAQTSTTKAAEAAASAAAFPAVYPLIGYKSRVDADLGNIFALDKLTELYIKNLQLLPNTVFLWSGVSGMKTRTSGSNVFASKLYNMANKVQQFGAELVTNGTFTTDTTGWTPVSSNLSIDSGRLKVENTASSNGNARQTISTVIGKTYHFSFTTITGTSVTPTCFLSTVSGGSDIYNAAGLSAGTKTISFVATTTSVYIRLNVGTALSGDYAFFDNISVKQMDWVEGTNDAVQTTEANQPYVGGVIAPNEVRKLKGLNAADNRRLDFSRVVFTENDNWSVSFAAKIFSSETQTIIGDTSNIGYIKINHNTILVNVRVLEIAFTNIAQYSDIGKAAIYTITCTGNFYHLYKEGKLLGSAVRPTGSLFQLNQLMISFNTSNDLIGELPHVQIHNRALSASEVQAQHEYLRLQIPEIEGIAIGNQYWATSNYEGVVAGDGSVINEVKESANVEKVVNGSFETGITGWSAHSTSLLSQEAGTRTGGSGLFALRATATGINQGAKQAVLIVNAYYKVTGWVRSDGNQVPRVWVGGAASHHWQGTTSTDWQYFSFYQKANDPSIFLTSGNSTTGYLEWDDVSAEEVGWSQSTALYDAVYAQTSGTTAQKELAALKAAAMWSYYNNDVNNGAVFGKLYNHYAIALLTYYPPKGWRVPSSADVTQMQTYLGGSTVAGGKMKALYGSFNNSFATNESGLTILPTGRRDPVGTFTNFSNFFGYNGFLTSDKFSVTAKSDSASLQIQTNVVYPTLGSGLRLLRNEPVGPNERMETSGVFDTNIASTAKQVPISFGYTVDCIRITNLQPSGGTNLTSVEAKVHNAAGTAIATLITGKTVNVASTMVYNISAEHAAMLQDGTVRVTATGNAAPGMIIEVVLKKATF